MRCRMVSLESTSGPGLSLAPRMSLANRVEGRPVRRDPHPRRARRQCRTHTAGVAITVGDAEASPSAAGLLARIPALQGTVRLTAGGSASAGRYRGRTASAWSDDFSVGGSTADEPLRRRTHGERHRRGRTARHGRYQRAARLHAEGGRCQHRRIRRAHDHHGGCGGRSGTHQPTARATRTAGPAPEPRRQFPGALTPRPTGTQPLAQATGSRATGRTELPRTGTDLERLVVAGLAATAGGAALVHWSAEAKSASSRAADSTSRTSRYQNIPGTGDRPTRSLRERLNRR